MHSYYGHAVYLPYTSNTHTYTHMHTHIQTHTHTHIHTHIHTHAHTHTHTCTHTTHSYAHIPAPVVLKFPEDTCLQEGEEVLFHVEVTGTPQPVVTWYYNGEEVVADYSKELSEDGSLTMSSAEIKHSGVYQLVARNQAGRVERKVTLTVVPEGAAMDGPSYAVVAAHGAIPVTSFGDHVEQKHSKNNKPFKDEFEVRMFNINIYIIMHTADIHGLSYYHTFLLCMCGNVMYGYLSILVGGYTGMYYCHSVIHCSDDRHCPLVGISPLLLPHLQPTGRRIALSTSASVSPALGTILTCTCMTLY